MTDDIAGARPPPSVVAFARGQAAVHERNLAGKRSETRRTVCGVSAISGTSRYGALALRQRFGDGAQIDLGFAAASHAVQQESEPARLAAKPVVWHPMPCC